MEFIDDKLLEYCEMHTQAENAVLAKLNRETHLKVSSPRMLSGHLQGRFLSLLSRLKQPQYILEIGTYTGYSALCLAEGLREDGKLFTIDPNEETNHFAKQFIQSSEHKHKIEMLSGQAQDIIPGINENLDLVFIDADKKNYSLYFDLVIDKVNSGGLIIADNVLWSGKVLDQEKDKETQAIHHFNTYVSTDKRVESLLLPVRDGLMLLQKL